MALIDYLEEQVITWRKVSDMNNIPFECSPGRRSQWLLDHGRRMMWKPLPVEYTDGEAKNCFQNACSLVIDDPGLIYCEGIAFSGGRYSIPVSHAWVIDPVDGRVIDNTWQQLSHLSDPDYFGVPFKSDYLFQVVSDKGSYGLIDNWEGNYPLLNGNHEKEEFHHEL